MPVYRFLADLVVLLHIAYVLFVIVGLILILLGSRIGWNWIRNLWFRSIHLTMITIVVVEALVGITCPLTTLENALRNRAGETFHQGSFVGYWAHELLFIDAPPWAFTVAYCLFGLLVLLAFVWAPPSWGKAKGARGGGSKVEG